MPRKYFYPCGSRKWKKPAVNRQPLGKESNKGLSTPFPPLRRSENVAPDENNPKVTTLPSDLENDPRNWPPPPVNHGHVTRSEHEGIENKNANVWVEHHDICKEPPTPIHLGDDKHYPDLMHFRRMDQSIIISIHNDNTQISFHPVLLKQIEKHCDKEDKKARKSLAVHFFMKKPLDNTRTEEDWANPSSFSFSPEMLNAMFPHIPRILKEYEIYRNKITYYTPVAIKTHNNTHKEHFDTPTLSIFTKNIFPTTDHLTPSDKSVPTNNNKTPYVHHKSYTQPSGLHPLPICEYPLKTFPSPDNNSQVPFNFNPSLVLTKPPFEHSQPPVHIGKLSSKWEIFQPLHLAVFDYMCEFQHITSPAGFRQAAERLQPIHIFTLLNILEVSFTEFSTLCQIFEELGFEIAHRTAYCVPDLITCIRRTTTHNGILVYSPVRVGYGQNVGHHCGTSVHPLTITDPRFTLPECWFEMPSKASHGNLKNYAIRHDTLRINIWNFRYFKDFRNPTKLQQKIEDTSQTDIIIIIDVPEKPHCDDYSIMSEAEREYYYSRPDEKRELYEFLKALNFSPLNFIESLKVGHRSKTKSCIIIAHKYSEPRSLF